jgi:hypothetical protein
MSIDGNDSHRRIARITAGGAGNDTWFDFYEYFGGNSTQAGRWGDITLLGDRLFLIDHRNDRLVAITTYAQGDAPWESDSFSLPGIESGVVRHRGSSSAGLPLNALRDRAPATPVKTWRSGVIDRESEFLYNATQ